MKNSFSISDAINLGFDKLKKRLGPILIMVIVIAIINVVLSLFNSQIIAPLGAGFSGIGQIMVSLFNTFIALGFIMKMIELYDNDEADLSLTSMFNMVDLNTFIKYILVHILTGLLIGLPTVVLGIGGFFMMQSFGGANFFSENMSSLLIVILLFTIFFIAVIHFSIRFMLAPFLIADKVTTSSTEALKISYNKTKGHVLHLFGFGLVCCLLAIAGLVALVIGLLFVYPILQTAFIHVYRSLIGDVEIEAESVSNETHFDTDNTDNLITE